MEEAGLRAAAGANYGAPLSRLAADSGALDWVVAEVSTFQLETVRRFRPAAAVLLNVYPNHLDRHRDMREYTALKLRLFADLEAGETGVVLETLREVAHAAGGRCRWTTFGAGPAADVRYAEGGVRWRSAAGEESLSLRGTRFDNEILGLTAAAAAGAMLACGVDPRCVARAAREFVPLPHRMAEVAVLRGVRFVDDSKATNLAATAAAIRMCGGPVRLIAGGLLKETDAGFVKELLAQRVKAAYLIGEAAETLALAWRDTTSCVPCGSLAAAVRRAWQDSAAGETVLLAPGCASFDQFSGYSQRGERFSDAVADLGQEVS
jgi:UDP-N-acetylmuramoylalanine--D-glutamate ligase